MPPGVTRSAATCSIALTPPPAASPGVASEVQPFCLMLTAGLSAKKS
jgi:hypothetical protein